MRPKLVLTLLLSLLLHNSMNAAADKLASSTKEYLLILNSYTSDAIWSNSIISSVQQGLTVTSNLDVYVEHMNMLMIDDSSALNQFKESFFTLYTHAPKVILLLGNSSFMMCDDLKKHWGEDIPFILCAELNYLSPFENYMKKAPTEVTEQVPLQQLTENYNLTTLQAKNYLPESVELIRKMVPDMKKLMFIGDGRYINQQLDHDLHSLLEKSFPDLEYEFLSAVHMTTDTLLYKLNQTDASTTGVLFSSWFYRRAYAGGDLLMANTYQVISNSAIPIFALQDAFMPNSRMVGGYYYQQQIFNKQLKNVIDAVLSGKAPKNIPFYIPEGNPVFDHHALLQKGVSTNLCPSNSIFLNLPQTTLDKYKYHLMGSAVLFTLLVLFTLHQYSRIKSLKYYV